MLKHLKAKHILGLGVSMALFSAFGMMAGIYVVAWTGVSMSDPIGKLATGPTTIPLMEVTGPFGLTPGDLFLPQSITLPGIAREMLQFTFGGYTILDLGLLMTLGQASATLGLMLGAAVGIWYLIDILMEKQQAVDPLVVEMTPVEEMDESDRPDQVHNGESQDKAAMATISCDDCGNTASVATSLLDESLLDEPDRPVLCSDCSDTDPG